MEAPTTYRTLHVCTCILSSSSTSRTTSIPQTHTQIQSTRTNTPTSNSNTMTDNTNPGNFANRPKEEVQKIASKGGQTGTENSGVSLRYPIPHPQPPAQSLIRLSSHPWTPTSRKISPQWAVKPRAVHSRRDPRRPRRRVVRAVNLLRLMPDI